MRQKVGYPGKALDIRWHDRRSAIRLLGFMASRSRLVDSKVAQIPRPMAWPIGAEHLRTCSACSTRARNFNRFAAFTGTLYLCDPVSGQYSSRRLQPANQCRLDRSHISPAIECFAGKQNPAAVRACEHGLRLARFGRGVRIGPPRERIVCPIDCPRRDKAPTEILR